MFIIHSNDNKKAIISDKIESIEVDIEDTYEISFILKLKINGIKVFSKEYKRLEDGEKRVYQLKNEIVQLIRIDKEKNSEIVREYYINDDATIVKVDNDSLKFNVRKKLW